MYQVGEKIVHPMHGAGVVDEIVERTIDGQTEPYYALRLALERILLYIPVRTSDSLGVRPVCSAEAAGELLHKLSELEVDPTLNWNRRYRRRGLSTGEKRMLSLSKQILTSELALALDREPAEMTREVIDLLCPRGRRAKKEAKAEAAPQNDSE